MLVFASPVCHGPRRFGACRRVEEKPLSTSRGNEPIFHRKFAVVGRLSM
jgi:hypothetical protein